jgi:hypothetical protein
MLYGGASWLPRDSWTVVVHDLAMKASHDWTLARDEGGPERCGPGRISFSDAEVWLGRRSRNIWSSDDSLLTT